MWKKEETDDAFWITFSDLFKLYKRAKAKIGITILLFALVISLYGLTRPLKYVSVASFREKNSKNGMNLTQTNLALSLFDGSHALTNGEAITTMQSKLMIKRLVHQKHLQGMIEKKEAFFPKIANIRDNLKVEWALFKKKQGPLFPDLLSPLAVEEITYKGEVPLRFTISFTSEETFEIGYSQKVPSQQGTLDFPFTIENVQFTLTRKTNEALTGREYYLSILPMDKVMEHLLYHLTVDTDRDDKTLIKLKYADSDRIRASTILNTLMELYQKYLKEQQQRIYDEQIAYLRIRQEEMKLRLRQMMNEHAAMLSADVLSMGFPDTKSAIQFFSQVQQKYSGDLLNIDLELKRLQHLEDSGEYYNLKASKEDTLIDSLYQKISKLKQQADSIELALGYSKEKGEISSQLDELQRVKQLSEEANEMIALVSVGKIPENHFQLFNDSRFRVNAWCNRLASSEREKEVCSLHFLDYLNHLIHLFRVQEKSLQEQLKNQRAVHSEFQGIDLETARALYIDYSKELSNIESDTAEKQFILTRMKDPVFEITSLSTVLDDDVSKHLITQANTLVLSLKDEHNRTPKEQERLREELIVQKQFIAQHLDQTIQLLQLRHNILKEKIRSVQTATLGLIQQEISVLEKHLTDYISLRQNQLYQERNIVEKHQSELQHDMAQLPKKWVSEKLIDQQMEMDKKMVEEISKLVEAKNTSNSLDLIQSAPMDLAFPPVQPQSPKLVLYLVLGGMLGAFASMGVISVQAVAKGFPVTANSLKMALYHVSGELRWDDSSKPLLDENLETLRRLMRFLEDSSSKRNAKGNLITLALGQSTADYSKSLAMLLSKKGKKILLLPLNFNRPAQPSETPGLLQYLEDQVDQPKVVQESFADIVYPGGLSRFASEAIGSLKFRTYLHRIKQQYDSIFIVSRAAVASPEIESLLGMSDDVVVTITEETWDEIKPLLCLAQQLDKTKNLSFII